LSAPPTSRCRRAPSERQSEGPQPATETYRGSIMIRERLDLAKRLALEAGSLTLQGFGKCDQMPKDTASGYYDIATEYDFRAEELIRRRILDQFGEPILGEEDGLIGDHETARNRLWIVDPIDGTFNYQRGLPHYAVSIAYCENGIPLCGAVYLPALDELFSAAKGFGAFLDRGSASSPTPVRVSQERALARLVISLLLCAVASLVYVAAGRIDAFTDTSLNPWDCAAGDIILQEAGGPATVDYRGMPIFPEYLNKHLDLGQTSSIPLRAASSPERLDDPLHRLISAAGLQR
jgi:myo-inositol-1(or 4)-monophosphatase